ncbi:MAG: TIR domain-containing protein [Bacillota bacterium]
MNQREAAGDEAREAPRPVFVSYATSDRKQALSVCEAIETRGLKCWISTRDVAPGDNYQEAIVRAIRGASAVVLVFSKAANQSDEIKKELSLASRHRIPVIALRIEEVEPGDAFAYELSTRQWIDAFEGWDRAMDLVVSRASDFSGGAAKVAPAASAHQRTRRFASRSMTVAALGVFLLIVAASAYWLWPRKAAAHSMVVRLGGFQLLSPDLPATFGETVDAEIAAAFNEDGVVGVSTASAPAAGTGPAYAIGGTIQRDGQSVRVITRLSNERSGETLWTGTFNYDGSEVAKVPRHVAVDAGNVVRCGLFGASTYRRRLSDAIFRDYMQFCQAYWDPDMLKGHEALYPAQRVVAAAPDFSWGWAAVAGSWWKTGLSAENPRAAEQARANGRQAADRAVALDPRNSEALWIKSLMIDPQDWAGREQLLKRAVAARRLDCGCEHHQYGWLLSKVGRISEAVDQLREADDMLALYVYTPLTLADALVAAGKPQEAKAYYQAAIDLAPDAGFAGSIRASAAAATGDTAALADPKVPLPAQLRAALLKGYRAAASADAAEKTSAIQALLALPEDQQWGEVALLLGRLGEKKGALKIAARLGSQDFPGPALFWYPSMRQVLDEPGFPAVAEQLGLMKYWKSTHSKPDACGEHRAPAFCRMI